MGKTYGIYIGIGNGIAVAIEEDYGLIGSKVGSSRSGRRRKESLGW